MHDVYKKTDDYNPDKENKILIVFDDMITFICSIILISHIAQLFLIRKFYCFRKGRHIYFKYARHNHLRCPMMGELSLET